MIFEDTLNNLMEEVWSDQFMDVRSREIDCVRLANGQLRIIYRTVNHLPWRQEQYHISLAKLLECANLSTLLCGLLS